jgi:zinc finger CCHC domain-containing protein 9
MSECPTADTTKCFKCGAVDHMTKECTVRNEGFPFATCFICKEVGHIARMCPDNPKGIYPQGGGCRFCGSVEHKRANCTERGKWKQHSEPEGLPTMTGGSADADLQSRKQSLRKKTQPTRKIVTF